MESNLENRKIMADNILYYMNRKGKTRPDLCKDLGFKYTTLTGWLKAEKYPRIDKIEKMANYFGISKANLVEERMLAISTEKFKQLFCDNDFTNEDFATAYRLISGHKIYSSFIDGLLSGKTKFLKNSVAVVCASIFDVSVEDLKDSSESKKPATIGDGLSEEQRELIAFVSKMSKDELMEMWKAAAEIIARRQL